MAFGDAEERLGALDGIVELAASLQGRLRLEPWRYEYLRRAARALIFSAVAEESDWRRVVERYLDKARAPARYLPYEPSVDEAPLAARDIAMHKEFKRVAMILAGRGRAGSGETRLPPQA